MRAFRGSQAVGVCVGWRTSRLRLARIGLLATLALLVSADAASAWHLTSAPPSSGCPGTEVALVGTSFSGSSTTAEWKDPSSLIFTSASTTAKVTSSTKATAGCAVLPADGRLWRGNRWDR